MDKMTALYLFPTEEEKTTVRELKKELCIKTNAQLLRTAIAELAKKNLKQIQTN